LESKDLDEINRATEALTAASHKLAELIYSKTRQGTGAQGGPAGGDGHTESSGTEGGDQPHGENKEDVVDADFKEVK
jgi:molecular chaperone DnaK